MGTPRESVTLFLAVLLFRFIWTGFTHYERNHYCPTLSLGLLNREDIDLDQLCTPSGIDNRKRIIGLNRVSILEIRNQFLAMFTQLLGHQTKGPETLIRRLAVKVAKVDLLQNYG
jgi:hypothetical protein